MFQSCNRTRIGQTFDNPENPEHGVQGNPLRAIVDCHVQEQRQRTFPKVIDLQRILHDDSNRSLHAKKLLPREFAERRHSTTQSVGARPLLAFEDVGQYKHSSEAAKLETSATYSNGAHARKFPALELGPLLELLCFCN